VVDLLSPYLGTLLAEIVVGLVAAIILITFMLLSAIFFLVALAAFSRLEGNFAEELCRE